MNLNEYPAKIEYQQRLILDRKNVVTIYRESMNKIEDTLKLIIWNDKSLKNETIRNVTFNQALLQDATWMEGKQELQQAEGMLAQSKIALERLMNDFAVAKIEVRYPPEDINLDEHLDMLRRVIHQSGGIDRIWIEEAQKAHLRRDKQSAEIEEITKDLSLGDESDV